MKWIHMYALLVRASIRSRMQYKFNFWFSSIMAAIINVVEFLMLAVILLKFGHIKGWSLAEAGYLYAVLSLSKALYRMFASDVHHLEKYLVTGSLDSLLLRPVPVLLALMSQNFSIKFGELIQGIAILAFSMGTMMQIGQITWTALPLTVIVILSGSVLLFAIGLLTATAGFWITRIEELQNITEDAARTAAQYPMSIYPKWLQGLLISVIPVGFANYMPSLYILRHEAGIWLVGLSILVALALFTIALRAWKIGLARYQSTGS
ncbi:ABC-2 family transporter protein [Paenibacillus sp. MER TA 81-3]|uniref:ABC transporter permease n=1 Tax=Paenibacillus sp. MER TA 81-3 TaxID=2939573 RepID=UPI00203E6B26|nr:ABC-2 family transporter protein [Paenibacillus sp. MER TA 81-3]MCM3341790.1 ABC-2 family transporter protein [Paenibacillus sp. MER TA 81-3]